MDAHVEWNLIEHMMVGDFNPYHDELGRFTFSTSVGAYAPLHGRSERGEKLLQAYKNSASGGSNSDKDKQADPAQKASETGEQGASGGYDFTKLDDAAKKLLSLERESDRLYRVGKDWFNRKTGKQVTQEEVDALFAEMKKTRAEWRELVEKAPDPSEVNQSSGNKAIRLCEDGIRNDKLETAFVVDEKGDPIIRKTSGLVDCVHFTSDEIERMPDGIFTHNHPNSTTFSPEDIKFAMGSGLREIRVCTKDGGFALRRYFEIGYAVPSNYLNFADDYKAQFEKVKAPLERRLRLGATKESCLRKLSERMSGWLMNNAAYYGWDYKEISL